MASKQLSHAPRRCELCSDVPQINAVNGFSGGRVFLLKRFEGFPSKPMRDLALFYFLSWKN
jgi:hypothetical protein